MSCFFGRFSWIWARVKAAPGWDQVEEMVSQSQSDQIKLQEAVLSLASLTLVTHLKQSDRKQHRPVDIWTNDHEYPLKHAKKHWTFSFFLPRGGRRADLVEKITHKRGCAQSRERPLPTWSIKPKQTTIIPMSQTHRRVIRVILGSISDKNSVRDWQEMTSDTNKSHNKNESHDLFSA